MKKTFLKIVVLCGILGIGLAGIGMANGALDGVDPPAIMVSPSTIVLAKVDTVSVHTNIPASTVAEGSLLLNDVAPVPNGVYADNLGHIAAKFAVAELKLEPGEAVPMMLTGDYKDSGGSFIATDEVRVK